MKNILTLLLVIIAIIAAYFILSLPPKPLVSPPQGSYKNNVTISSINDSIIADNESIADPQIFSDHLMAAQNVFIIQDLRNVTNDTIRKNIQQCGIDFAGSSGLVDKNLSIFAFEGDKCTSLDGIVDINICLDKLKFANITIQIKQADKTLIYKNKLLVGIGKNYPSKSCSISVQQTETTTPIIAGNNTLNSSLKNNSNSSK